MGEWAMGRRGYFWTEMFNDVRLGGLRMSMQLVSHVDEMSNAAMSCLGKVSSLRKKKD